MHIIILAGGFGTRLEEETSLKPKPMVEIGGRPILWHIMKSYAAHGYDEFLIALGYKGEIIKQYFLNYYHLNNNFTINTATGETMVHRAHDDEWRVHLIDTGLATQTGGRIKRLAEWVRGETFMLTYGDGLCDVDIKQLVAFHRSHGKLATVTAVRPPARFGGLHLEGDAVGQFIEKPLIGEGWVSGGFFVMEPGVLDFIEDDATVFERGPLERLAAAGQLMAYRHDGFWQCMDTIRDVRLLEGLWQSGQAPWKGWEG
ncbi:MAG TPA: glucose-1-phosphate cytidylyltransferase [Herpetosiphonaceae bacterium]